MIDSTRASLIVICPESLPLWAENILTHLSKKDYQVTRTKPKGKKGNHLLHINTVNSDAILFFRQEDGIALSQNFKQLENTKMRPLLILVTDTDDSDAEEQLDIVYLHTGLFLENQLESILNLHQDKLVHIRENDQLKEQLSIAKENMLQQERTTREVEILKNAIVRNVSHELKTPLLQVKAAVALLAEDVKDEKLITYAKGATARLETLVKNITMLGSSLDQNLSPVIVRDTIEYARRNLGRVWEHHASNERVILDIQENLSPVLADKQGLSTVLQLLMDNALKFSKSPQDSITVEVKETDGIIRITVKDDGIGIAKEQLSSIFESFYQIDNSSTRRYGGMGIGLAIVRLIMDNHNTKIHVHSEIGKGSRFWFDLPIFPL